jgi:hypothetical protein
MDFLHRYSGPLNASWAGAMSWWISHLSDQSLGLFLRKHSRNFVSTSIQHCWFAVSPCEHNSQLTIPLQSKKHTSVVLKCEGDVCAFLGQGDFCVLHWVLWPFRSGSYWKHKSFITGNDLIKHLCVLWNISWIVKPTSLPVIYQDSWHHLCGKFPHSQILRSNMWRCFLIHIQVCD